ncbi:MAG TPA: hypothetical protein VNS83_08880 [Lapillicoccus sp.]|nr:hypothetical protein [Lapillicoccus sp.]
MSFSPFNYTDLGQPGPSAAGLSNCTGVIRLEGRGTLTFAFVNAPPPHQEPAITEGSGQFRSVRCDGTLDESSDGTGTLVLRLVS